MNEYAGYVKSTLMQIGVWGCLACTSLYLAGFSHLLAGFLLGLLGSVFYYLLMVYRVKKSANLPPAKAVVYMRGGWLIRLSFIILILILSLKIPQVNFLAAVAGVFSLHIVLFFNAVIVVVKSATLHKIK